MGHHMKRIVLAGAAALALATSAAQAADMAVKAPAYAPPPLANWSGFYIGANLGYGWAKEIATGAGSMNGVIGGGQIGYNWQPVGSAVVFGLEADLQASGQGRTDTVLGVSIDQDIDYIGTIRARLGYAPGPWMLYVTGGWAYAKYEVTGTLAGASVSSSTSHSAWTLGGGVEWMFAPRWSAKLEYLYLDSGDVNATLFGVPVAGRLKDNIARIGLNYHF
jgi:outer membrane immunogenic protein